MVNPSTFDRRSSSSSNSPSTPRHSSADSRRALRDKSSSTPVGRVLASESRTVRSPRRYKQRSWTEKAQEYPSNLLLSLETSLSSLSLDPLGYPIGIGLNAVQLLTRLPALLSSSTVKSNKYLNLSDADARLEALKRQGHSKGWKLVTVISIVLVLFSFANAIYLFTRRRKYQLMLRTSPLDSPNATTGTLDFRPTRRISATLKTKLIQSLPWPINLIWKEKKQEEHKTFEIQELSIWTPEYVKWSLRIFTLYPPPLPILYHLTTHIPSILLLSPLFILQTYLLVTTYTQLLSDRQIIQSEVMREYNTRFVAPRINVMKVDEGTSTSQAEFVDRNEWTSGAAEEKGRRRSMNHLGVGTDERSTPTSRRATMGPEEVASVATSSPRRKSTAREEPVEDQSAGISSSRPRRRKTMAEVDSGTEM